MKKIIAWAVAVAASFNILTFTALAQKTETADTSEQSCLVNAVLEDGVPLSDTETREEFADALVKLLKLPSATVEEEIFFDVDMFNKYYSSIYTALEHGIISENMMFEPKRAVTNDEAVKMAVTAVGYGIFARENGGYPNGYFKAAGMADLLDGMDFSASSTLTKDNCYILLYNILNAYLYEYTIQNGHKQLTKTDKTALQALYKLEKTEGIVSKTTYNSLDMNDKSIRNGQIEINGEKYLMDELDASYLGMRCKAYYTENDGDYEVVCLYPYKNNELNINLEDVTKNGNIITYYNGEKRETAELDGGSLMVYNDRVCQFDDSCFESDSGKLRLVDNDNDNDYDMVFVEISEYMYVTRTDSVKKTLSDNNDNKLHLDLLEVEIKEIRDSASGEELFFADIPTSRAIAYRMSKDKKLISIDVCKQVVNGKIEAAYDNKVVIGGVSYNVSRYFEKYYGKYIKAGQSGTFVLGIYNDIVCMSSTNTEYQYGYLLKVWELEWDDTVVECKMYTTDGIFEIIPLAEKIKMDGKSEKSKAVKTKFADTPQLVRFKRNSDGYMSNIDFSEQKTDGKIASDLSVDDSLTKYNDSDMSQIYKSGGKVLIESLINVRNAVVFYIPDDISDEKAYSAGSSAGLVSGETYTIKGVYDIDETKSSKAIVIESTKSNRVFGASHLITKVLLSHNSDDEIGYRISCWSNGNYGEYFLPESVEYLKNTENKPCEGDIVRFVADAEGTINTIIADVDFYGGTVKDNTENGGLSLTNGKANCSYYSGWAYSIIDGYLGVSKKKTDALIDDWGSSELEGKNILIYHTTTETCEEATASELETYADSAENADYVVLRQNNYQTQYVFVYDFE